MAKKLAGVIFTYNALKHDYCFMQSIECLRQFCEHVYVVDAGSDDGTREMLLEHWQVPKVTIISRNDWHEHTGKEKLCYFTDIAIEAAQKDGYEYVFSLQADEVLHESCFADVWDALNAGFEGYLVGRVNLWGTPYTRLNVPENRQPCSTAVIRLAKSCYRTYGDAESINALAISDYISRIRIYHMGFVRRREIMVEKIRHMQADVFGLTPDAKLSGMTVFDPWKWFEKSEVSYIDERLPALVEQWARERSYI